MSDLEAVERLQSIMIAACEGTRDLSADRAYKQIRQPLIRRDDLFDVVPKFVRAHRDLNSLWSYMRKFSDKWAPRRDHVWESFRPLFERVEGKTKPPIQSSKWTGRRTASQQARVVLQLAPDALHGVELLLEDMERPLHNGGPVDHERRDAIDKLRELHSAIGELIILAEQEKPLSAQLAKVRQIKGATFKWSADSYRLAVGGLPLMTASTVLGCGVMMLVNVLTKGAVDGALIGTAAMGVHAVGASKE